MDHPVVFVVLLVAVIADLDLFYMIIKDKRQFGRLTSNDWTAIELIAVAHIAAGFALFMVYKD